MFISKNYFFIKFIICSFLSFFIYLSFRIDLIYEKNLNTLISFFLIQFIIWSLLIALKSKWLSVIFYNFFFIIFLNLILTPVFHLVTHDVPTRQPNYKITIDYKRDFFKGIFFGKHIISSDERGFRTNMKIDYDNKSENTLRIFSIGASTTEQGGTDNDKTWSSLLGQELKKFSAKKIEIINAGMAGLRTEHHYLTLKRIKKYEPNLIIFMLGINDWNYHIIKNDLRYLNSTFEIDYNFKKSILYNTFGNMKNQFRKKLLSKNSKKVVKTVNEKDQELEIEEFLKPQINSLVKRKIVKKFRPKGVSKDYEHWLNLILNECKKEKFTCLFLDQPNSYKSDISNELKERLWMTPPEQNYTLSLEDLILTSNLYNKWLEKKVTNNKLNFIPLSEKIEGKISYIFDDCHFTEKGSEEISKVLAQYINLNLKSILN